VNLVEDGQRAIEQLKTAGTIPSNLQISSIYDASERIRLDLQHLLRDGLITVTIVIAVHFLIIGAIEAFVAGMVVPIVFFLTFVVMSIYGMSLNFLSMFALILSL
jgi:multidrug efflux pump subunit AcrB